MSAPSLILYDLNYRYMNISNITTVHIKLVRCCLSCCWNALIIVCEAWVMLLLLKLWQSHASKHPKKADKSRFSLIKLYHTHSDRFRFHYYSEEAPLNIKIHKLSQNNHEQSTGNPALRSRRADDAGLGSVSVTDIYTEIRDIDLLK